MQIDYIELLICAILASFGGLVKRMVEIENAPKKKKPSMSYFMAGSLISMFVGLVVYFICKNFDVQQLLTFCLTALAGYMGSPVLDLLSDLARKKLIKRTEE